MSSTATSIIATGIAVSAMQRAKKAECSALVSGFQHETATVEQRQDYAECVGVLHPDPLDPASIIALKVVIVLSFLATLIGGWMNFRQLGDLSDGALGALIGFMVVWAAAAAVLLAWTGIKFVLS